MNIVSVLAFWRPRPRKLSDLPEVKAILRERVERQRKHQHTRDLDERMRELNLRALRG